MNITSAKYYTEFDGTDNIGIKLKIGDETVFVPLDPANRHYQEIQEWVAEGNTIEDAD
jgi:translation initiation factor 6 (eIF-6)